MMSNMHFLRYMKVRYFSVKADIKLDDAVNTLLDKNLLKYRKHPGIISPQFIEIPKWIKNSIETFLKDLDISKNTLYEGGKKLAQHLNGRQLVIEQQNLQNKSKRLYADGMHQNVNELDRETCSRQQQHAKHVHNSNPIQYDRQIGLYYVAGRSLYDYSVLCNVLNEIKNNDNNFKPRTLFDFGSGIGTVMWAASQLWPGTLQEYFAVDASSEMHNLSEELAKQNIHPIKNIFYRQFFPATSPSYDIVISSFSLLDLPDIKTRFDVILKLWRITNNYLVIIEEGTNAGFTAVNEARDIVLSNTNFKSNDNSKFAHVVAPCPHDMQCPRYTMDNTPCNFEISYYSLPLLGSSILKRERFSYVILKKGVRSNNCKQWPRIVRPPLKRSKHVICRTCTAAGKLEEFIFTSYKYGKNAYRCARVSKWGDLLPVEVNKDK